MHDKYQNNVPITEEELSSTYYDLNKLYYGDNIVNDDLIRATEEVRSIIIKEQNKI